MPSVSERRNAAGNRRENRTDGGHRQQVGQGGELGRPAPGAELLVGRPGQFTDVGSEEDFRADHHQAEQDVLQLLGNSD